MFESFPELGGFSFPGNPDVKRVRASLAYSIGQNTCPRPQGKGPTQASSQAKTWCSEITDDFTDLKRLVEVAISSIRPDSTPGFPWSLRFQTNKDVIKNCKDELIDSSLRRLKLVLYSDVMPEDPVELYKQGFHGLVSPFEKWEPHPARKAVNGKWRIVNCLSVVDQIVERVLLTPAVNAVKAAYPVSGAVVGIGFSDDHVAQFSHQVVGTPLLGWSSDVGGWERSLDKSYVYEASNNIKRNLVNPESHKILLRAISRHAILITHPVFIVPTPGYEMYELVTRLYPGGMLSGSYLTTLYNTLCRLDVSYLAGVESPRAAGDDCLDGTTCSEEVLRARYAKLGYTLRDVAPIKSDGFSFCSHRLHKKDGKWCASLESWPKALFNTLSKPLTPEREAAFYYEMRHNNNFDELIACIQEYGNRVPDEL